MDPALAIGGLQSRRAFLRRSAHGFGALALATMLAEEAAAAPSRAVFDPFLPKKPHFEAKAKSAIGWRAPYQAASYCMQNNVCLDDAG